MSVRCVLGAHAVHAQGIAHRDLKPENLLVSKDGRLLITDFGVSETYSQASDLTAKKAGSPAFMAPEIFLSSSTCPAPSTGRCLDLLPAHTALTSFILVAHTCVCRRR